MYSCRENRKILLRICPFFCLYPLCWNSNSKIVLSHAHKWVSSNVILKKIFFSSYGLSWRSRHGEWVNIAPKKAWQHGDSCVVNFWRETKNSANWCAQQS